MSRRKEAASRSDAKRIAATTGRPATFAGDEFRPDGTVARAATRETVATIAVRSPGDEVFLPRGLVTGRTLARIREIGPDGRAAADAILRAAFDAVADRADWKAAIDREIDLATWGFAPEVLAEGVRFMTATEARWAPVAGNDGRIRIVADGYRAGPAGP